MTKKRLLEIIRREVHSQLNKKRLRESFGSWSYRYDGKAELKNPEGGYFVCSADDDYVFMYSISLHKSDNSIQYLKKGIDGEARLNQELVKLGLPKVDAEKYHNQVSNWYDELG